MVSVSNPNRQKCVSWILVWHIPLLLHNSPLWQLPGLPNPARRLGGFGDEVEVADVFAEEKTGEWLCLALPVFGTGFESNVLGEKDASQSSTVGEEVGVVEFRRVVILRGENVRPGRRSWSAMGTGAWTSK